MECYLDQSATTRIDDAVLDLMLKVYREDYGNPSSMHKKGVEADRYIRTAREQIAKTLRVQPREIFFTSGGTESNNLALIGAAMANRRKGNKILTTAYEHASVLAPAKFLEEQGFEVVQLPVDPSGQVDLDALKAEMTPDVILVSIMQVNNEIGALNPVGQIGALIKEIRPDVIYHVDAIQAYGKFTIRPNKDKIDLLSASGHKIHGPKGTGFLYIREKTRVSPLLLGGGQQEGMRSGTENVPGIAGLGLAAERIYADLSSSAEKMYALREDFISQILQIPGCTVNGPKGREGAPHIVSVSAQGLRSEVLLHALEDRGIYVSAGSACSSHKRAPSATLSSIGLRRELIDATIRFSFSVVTTKEEIDYAASAMREIVPQLRRYVRQ